MSDREQEICMTVELIHRLCTNAAITLVPKEVKGALTVIAKDSRTDKEYAIVME